MGKLLRRYTKQEFETLSASSNRLNDGRPQSGKRGRMSSRVFDTSSHQTSRRSSSIGRKEGNRADVDRRRPHPSRVA